MRVLPVGALVLVFFLVSPGAEAKKKNKGKKADICDQDRLCKLIGGTCLTQASEEDFSCTTWFGGKNLCSDDGECACCFDKTPKCKQTRECTSFGGECTPEEDCTGPYMVWEEKLGIKPNFNPLIMEPCGCCIEVPPTMAPTLSPTNLPTDAPSDSHTDSPTDSPIEEEELTDSPTASPSEEENDTAPSESDDNV